MVNRRMDIRKLYLRGWCLMFPGGRPLLSPPTEDWRQVGESRGAKVTGHSEIEEAKEGPSRERSKNWTWNLPEISS